MGGTRDAEEDFRRGVAVVDGEVRESGWQQLDLDLVLGSLPSPAGISPTALSTPASGIVRSFPQTARELAGALKLERLKRVPASAFVVVGRRAGAGAPRLRPRTGVMSRSANDNVAAGERRSVWRDLFFLVVLAATVAGAFWSGRIHAYQKVIVVPAPSSFYSIVT